MCPWMLSNTYARMLPPVRAHASSSCSSPEETRESRETLAHKCCLWSAVTCHIVAPNHLVMQAAMNTVQQVKQQQIHTNECKRVMKRWKITEVTVWCWVTVYFLQKVTKFKENQLSRTQADVRASSCHITFVQFCILDRQDLTLETTVFVQQRFFHLHKHAWLQLLNVSQYPCEWNSSVGENKEREIKTKPGTVGSDGALL